MITIKVLLNSLNALKVLADQPIPAITSFKLSKMFKDIQEILDTYEGTRLSLLGKYGIKNDDEYEIDENQADVFKEEFEGLLEADTGLAYQKININELENIAIEPSLLMSIDWLLE